MNLLRLTHIVFIVFLTTGCVSGPTRESTDQFFVLKQDRIRPDSWNMFADCLLDGFDKSHYVLTNITHRQVRRADSVRVESLAGGHIITISADVFENGIVVLNESKAASLINTTGQRETFSICLEKYKIAR